ncbi:MAG: hypothetical protein IJP12_01115 [Methanobrevibacter sp.]|nr:hypothetical protein [Methanobrevibacter sp.]
MSNLNKNAGENGYDETDPKKLKIAKAISTITNPPILSIPLFLLISIILASSGSPFSSTFRFDWGLFALCEAISLVFASVLPMAIILYWAKKLNTDKDISNREDRFAPLIIGTVSYFIGCLISYFLNLPYFLTILLLCYTTNTFIVMLITSKWKISVHTTGLSGPVGALIMLIGPVGALFGSIYPVLIWSRVTLKKHTMAQAITGGFQGFVLTVGETYLFMAIFGISIANLVPLGECLWIIAGIVACPTVLGLIGLLEKKGIDELYRRKIFHFLTFTGFIIFYFYGPFSGTVTLILTGIVSVLISCYGGEHFSWFRGIRRLSERPKENLSILLSMLCGAVWIVIGMNFFSVEITTLATLCLAAAFAVGEPIGAKLANHKFNMKSLLGNNGNKSIESSVTVLILSMIVLLLFTQNFIVSISVGLVLCLIETFLPRELENLIVPLVAAVILKFLFHY